MERASLGSLSTQASLQGLSADMDTLGTVCTGGYLGPWEGSPVPAQGPCVYKFCSSLLLMW